MEKVFALFKLGLKYLYRYRRRYGFLLAALVFGFAIITFIISAKDGMYDNVYYTAQSHYAGDIIAMGNDSSASLSHLGHEEISAIIEAAETSGINPAHTVKRTIFGERGVVYFNGNAVSLKYVIGSEWENESHLFEKINFSEISESDFGDDGIILSVPVAKKLGARVGDSVILEVETRWWQKNTGVFVVKGIVQDASIFGYYKAYIPKKALNNLVLFDDDECSTIGFFLDDPAKAEKKRVMLQNILAEKIQMGPLVYNRDELNYETGQPWEGIKVFLYTMPVYLSEISDLLSAMNIIAYFLFAMMLLIILVSAAVTYRLIIHERTREMGIMRAIGFFGADLRFVLWTEIVVLGIISLIGGFIAARFLTWILSLLSFSWFPSMEIFMQNGKFTALYLPFTMFINSASILLALFAAVFFPSLLASKKKLTGLLSGEEL